MKEKLNVMENVMLKTKAKQIGFENGIKKKFVKQYKSGSQTTDFMIIALIVVIVGAALLKLLEVAMPDLFQSILDKIKSTFSV